MQIASVLLCSALLSGPAPGAEYAKTKTAHTSFQTPTGYLPENDIKTDAVIVYDNRADKIKSWKDAGYVVQTMYGFRTGPDYIKDHPDEVQTAADGTMLTCGPGSYYMVPTDRRVEAAVDYFTEAITNGASAVIPEEPEFFTAAGYSDSFKKACQEHYGKPWHDPTSSIEARYASERLKAKMEYDMVKAIVDAARKQNRRVKRMVACHSPVSYYSWGIVYPHYQCLMMPSLQEIIGQVWTGTARTACRYAGVKAERTFENGFLEYSSLANLVRGTGKRLWFLMDPLEDNPDRSMEDYRGNYIRTLVAALMFPEVDAYEVMPWPTRIYGRVPDDYATIIGGIINALGDMHSQKTVAFDTGTRGIATFVADSMGWQRGSPHASDFDCFYGLTLPLIYKGIPIQVAQLERTPEKGYLDPYKVLFLSYDILKPMKPEYNEAIARWVKKGGVLVFFGGSDAYDALPEWWRKNGLASPMADLYARLEVNERFDTFEGPGEYTVLERETKAYRNMENRKVRAFGLSALAETVDPDTPIYVRFRDAFPEDGWGPAVGWVKLMVDGKTCTEFKPGTNAEKEYLAADSESAFNGACRFADGEAFWVYEFSVPPDSKPVLEVDVGNQFVIETSLDPTSTQWRIIRSGDIGFADRNERFYVPSRFRLTAAQLHVSDVFRGQVYHGPDMNQVVFERKCGKGWLLHVGIEPSYFACSPEAADRLRAIGEYACGKAGLRYREQERMAIRRGKYVAVRTFDGEKRLKGTYVDLLDHTLPVLRDPVVKPDDLALHCDVTGMLKGSPGLLYSTSKAEDQDRTTESLRLMLSGPLKTRGTARVYIGEKKPVSISSASGLEVDYGTDNTLLLTYDNQPAGLEVEIRWEAQ